MDMSQRRVGRPLADDNGFTLIELLAVTITIGPPPAVAIPVFLNQRAKGYDAQAKSDLRELANFEELYLNDYSRYGTAAEIQVGEPQVHISPGVTVTVVAYNGALSYCL